MAFMLLQKFTQRTMMNRSYRWEKYLMSIKNALLFQIKIRVASDQ